MDEILIHARRSGKSFECGYRLGYEQGLRDAKENQKKWTHSVVKHLKKTLKRAGFYEWRADQ